MAAERIAYSYGSIWAYLQTRTKCTMLASLLDQSIKGERPGIYSFHETLSLKKDHVGEKNLNAKGKKIYSFASGIILKQNYQTFLRVILVSVKIIKWLCIVFFKKMGQSLPLYCLFLSFSRYNFSYTNWKSIDSVLGIRTRDCTMQGAHKTTELWRLPHECEQLESAIRSIPLPIWSTVTIREIWH